MHERDSLQMCRVSPKFDVREEIGGEAQQSSKTSYCFEN